ncbi:hypothetical protein JW710_00005 [Candidatus Dojkabacteria bacterium]|nr:hypothetical protein [Candidatus Dojkabacteria bacterium]
MKPSKTASKFIQAIALMLGTIIGSGIFSLPYSFNKAPFLSIIILCGSALILIGQYFIYLDLVFEPGIGVHQLPGIVTKLFGKKARLFTTIITIISRTGTLFLYIILLGDFTSILLKNLLDIEIGKAVTALVIAFVGSLAIRKKLGFLSKIQVYLSLALALPLAVVSWYGIFKHGLSESLRDLAQNEIIEMSPWDALKAVGLIYGTGFAALTGTSSVPSLKRILNNEVILRITSVIATIVSVFIYTGFAFFVILNSDIVSTDGLSGLNTPWQATIFAGVGIICIITSFLSLGNSLFEIYNIDHKIPANISWLLTIIPPALLLLFRIGSIPEITALVGGTFGGIEGIIMFACYWKEEKKIGELTGWLKAGIIIIGTIIGIGVFLSL